VRPVLFKNEGEKESLLSLNEGELYQNREERGTRGEYVIQAGRRVFKER